MSFLNEVERRFVKSVGLLYALCISFYVYRILITGTWRFTFILSNLLLAWLGLIFGWLLARQVKGSSWVSWDSLTLTVLWLAFLPNTWYVLTDFLHVRPTGEVSEIYDIVLIGTLVINGFILGFTSLYLVHRQLIKRVSENWSLLLVAGVILISSFAIYLGRNLRWNSWDVIANPSGVILSVSDRIVDPLGHPRALNITGLFFILLSSIYFSIWTFFHPPKSNPRTTPKQIKQS
jgi:uncharacterized membrane protein